MEGASGDDVVQPPSSAGLVSFIFWTQLPESLTSMNGFSFVFGENKTSYKTGENTCIMLNCKAILACVLRHPAFSPVIFCYDYF